MRNIVYLYCFICFFASCVHDTKPSFIYLDKLSGKQIVTYKNEYGFRDVILVENSPNDKDSALKLMDKYLIDNGKNMCLFDSTIKSYGIRFYRKTRNTSYFINKAEDPGGFSSYLISDYPEDELNSYYFERSKQNPHVWVSWSGGEIVDTVAICK